MLSIGLHGASPTGGISGIIYDPTGAVVLNASINATHEETRSKRAAKCDATGRFLLSVLPPGNWSVSVEAPGFREVVMLGTTVNVDQTTHLQVRLSPGELRQIIEVHSPVNAIDTQRTGRTYLTPRPVISAMPLNGRQFLDLALLTPGVVPAPTGTQGGGFNVSGMRSQSNVFLLDGISNTDTQSNQPLNLFRITEAVREFSVQTSGAPPASGRGTGAQVNVVTRSGSDRFQGSLFEYLRNTVFEATDFFTNKFGGTKSPLNRNQYGASLGGYLIRGRTFFFASWEGFRQSAPTVSVTITPTLQQRESVTDPISKKLLPFYPLPNGGTRAAGTYISNVKNADSDDTGHIRLDHNVSVKDRAMFRWTQVGGYGESPGATSLSGGNAGRSGQISAMVSENHSFTAATINELRLGYSRYNVLRSPQDANFDAGSILTGAAGQSLPGVPRNAGLPTISIGGGFAQLGAGMNFPQGRSSHTFELFDSVTHAGPGKHAISYGVHIRREDSHRYIDRASRGVISFANFADFARGQINTSTFRSGSTYAAWRRYPTAFYWQDQYRPTGGLSISYGLRYELPSAAGELRNRAVNYVPDVGPIVAGTGQVVDIDPAARGLAAIVLRPANYNLPSSGMYADRNNLAPMLGIAWTPGRFTSTVIRTGARVAYDELFNNVPGTMALAPPFNLQTTQTANVTQPGRFGWALTFDQDVPLISNYGRQGAGSPAVGVISLQGLDPRLQNARAILYHFGVEHQIGQTVFEADYQGSSGHNLGMYIDVNQPSVIVRDPSRRGPVAPNEQLYPDVRFGQIQLAKSIGTSNYNGLVLQARRQTGNGLFVQASYTYGKSLDYNSSYFGTGNQPGEPGAPIDNRNLRLEHGPSSFDIRNRFIASAVYIFQKPGKLPRPAAALLRNWTISGIATLQSGNPFTVVQGGPDTSGFNQATQGNSPNAQNRPNLIGAGPVRQDNGNPDAAFDASRFVPTSAGQPGTAGRNILYGPGLRNYNLALSRRVFLRREGLSLEVRGEAFNVLNHPNFGTPVADQSNANFGRITQSAGSAATNSTTGGVTGGSRILQFLVRIQF